MRKTYASLCINTYKSYVSGIEIVKIIQSSDDENKNIFINLIDSRYSLDGSMLLL